MDFICLKRKFDDLNVLAENQEEKLRYHETRANNGALAYLLWERFFVFGISHTSSSLSLNCTHWRMVLAFSLSSSFLYFLFFLHAIAMFYRAHYLLDMICNKQIEICQQLLDAPNPDDAGLSMEAADSDGFDFSFHLQVLKYRPFRTVQRKLYIGSIVCALLAVTAFELYMCKYSLCN